MPDRQDRPTGPHKRARGKHPAPPAQRRADEERAEEIKEDIRKSRNTRY